MSGETAPSSPIAAINPKAAVFPRTARVDNQSENHGFLSSAEGWYSQKWQSVDIWWDARNCIASPPHKPSLCRQPGHKKNKEGTQEEVVRWNFEAGGPLHVEIRQHSLAVFPSEDKEIALAVGLSPTLYLQMPLPFTSLDVCPTWGQGCVSLEYNNDTNKHLCNFQCTSHTLSFQQDAYHICHVKNFQTILPHALIPLWGMSFLNSLIVMRHAWNFPMNHRWPEWHSYKGCLTIIRLIFFNRIILTLYAMAIHQGDVWLASLL